MTNTSRSSALGAEAEKFAERYLTEQGLRLIVRNYRCKLGEIDLIMQEGELLVFVEVRYRKGSHFGSASETVTYFKQQKIIKAASYYLQTTRLYNYQACRFDVIALEKQAKDFKLQWIKDAFRVL